MTATAAELRRVADLLAAGDGPFAIDTERASAFRYDDRAFLLQIRRRGAGTFLIDPESLGAQCAAILGPVINGADWIVHAAPSDLPCLAWLGLHAGTLFDTELAARFAGYERTNLGALIEEVFDVVLEKGHAYEDWSTRPLPRAWLAYAALDVELLLELAEFLTALLAETDKLSWCQAECAQVVEDFSAVTGPGPQSWRDMKGISTLKEPAQLNAAAALWARRDEIARERDVAPGTLLPHRVIVEIARTLPRTPFALNKVSGFPRRKAGATVFWMDVLESAYAVPAHLWPPVERPRHRVPTKTTLQKDHPEIWEAFCRLRDMVDAMAQDVGMSSQLIVSSAHLRALAWAALEPAKAREKGVISFDSFLDAGDFHALLMQEGAREWQADLVAPLASRCFLGGHA